MSNGDYYYIKKSNGVSMGPFTAQKIRQLQEAGKIRLGEARVVRCSSAQLQAPSPPSPPPPPVPEECGNLVPLQQAQESEDMISPALKPPHVAEAETAHLEETPPPDIGGGPQEDGRSVWEVVFSSLWIGHRCYQPLLVQTRRLAAFVIPYSLLAVLGPLMFRLTAGFGSFVSWCYAAVLGLALWLLLWGLSFANPILASWCSGRRFRLDAAAKTAVLECAFRWSTVAGTIAVFQKCLRLELRCALPFLILLGLAGWFEFVHWKMLSLYARLGLAVRERRWCIGTVLITMAEWCTWLLEGVCLGVSL